MLFFTFSLSLSLTHVRQKAHRRFERLQLTKAGSSSVLLALLRLLIAQTEKEVALNMLVETEHAGEGMLVGSNMERRIAEFYECAGDGDFVTPVW